MSDLSFVLQLQLALLWVLGLIPVAACAWIWLTREPAPVGPEPIPALAPVPAVPGAPDVIAQARRRRNDDTAASRPAPAAFWWDEIDPREVDAAGRAVDQPGPYLVAPWWTTTDPAPLPAWAVDQAWTPGAAEMRAAIEALAA